MKKIITLIFIFLILSSFAFSFVSANTLSEIEESLRKTEEKASETQEKIKDAEGLVKDPGRFVNQTNFSFKNILLKNYFVQKVDAGLGKISIVFSFFLGVPYSFSFSFFAIILIWIFFVMNLSSIISATGHVNKISSIFFVILAMAALGWLGFFEGIISISKDFIMLQDSFFIRVLFFLVIVGLFFALEFLFRKTVSALKGLRKKSEKREIELDRKMDLHRSRERRKTREELLNKFRRK